MGKVAPDTKQKLIDTALGLIWCSSYGAVSVDDICKASGVKKGSFYHFFPSKVDLALAAMEESWDLMRPTFTEIFSPERPPVQRFEALADYVIEQQRQALKEYGQVCGCPHATLGSEMAGQEDLIRQKFDEILKRKDRFYENAIRDLIAEGKLPPDTDVSVKAQEIHAYLLGQSLIARIQNDLEPVARHLKPGLLRIIGVDTPVSAPAAVPVTA